jgi:uncharacterized protein (DUF488 family)
MDKPKVTEIYSIGHSNRSSEEFVSILKEYKIKLIFDIRRFPVSKWGWFKKEKLKEILEENGVKYEYIGDLLGGFRKGGYVSYMETDAFKRGIEKIMRVAKRKRIAIMCTEKLFFKCHRRFISLYLQKLGVRVAHIIDRKKT